MLLRSGLRGVLAGALREAAGGVGIGSDAGQGKLDGPRAGRAGSDAVAEAQVAYPWRVWATESNRQRWRSEEI